MKYYTTKTSLYSKRFVLIITLLFILFFCVYALFLIQVDPNPNSTALTNTELEYVPNEINSDSDLLEPLSSETSFPGGMPSFLQKTRHDPEIMNIEDNIETHRPVKK